ncbi:hypothetical protein CF327_g7462 [Tilletia walkeri]|nr:hypothetical protein CF327_g7462 [Tilletia walkeri]
MSVNEQKKIFARLIVALHESEGLKISLERAREHVDVDFGQDLVSFEAIARLRTEGLVPCPLSDQPDDINSLRLVQLLREAFPNATAYAEDKDRTNEVYIRVEVCETTPYLKVIDTELKSSTNRSAEAQKALEISLSKLQDFAIKVQGYIAVLYVGESQKKSGDIRRAEDIAKIKNKDGYGVDSRSPESGVELRAEFGSSQLSSVSGESWTI